MGGREGRGERGRGEREGEEGRGEGERKGGEGGRERGVREERMGERGERRGGREKGEERLMHTSLMHHRVQVEAYNGELGPPVTAMATTLSICKYFSYALMS